MRMLASPGGVCCMMQGPHSGAIRMRRFFSRGAYAIPLAVLTLVTFPAFAEQPLDLSDYRTVATAKTATPAALVGAGEQRPAYLGVNAEPDTGGLRVVATEPDSPASR